MPHLPLILSATFALQAAVTGNSAMALVGLAITIIVQTAVLAYWAGKVHGMLAEHHREIARLRDWKHGELGPQMRKMSTDIADLRVKD